MGNKAIKDVLDYERNKEYTFVGRQNEINEIKELLKSKDIVQIFGMTKIGKSRLLVQLLAEFYQQLHRTCFYHDFKEDNLENGDDLIELLQDFQKEVKNIATDKTEKAGSLFSISSAINELKDTLKTCSDRLTEPVLFLDNLEMGFMDKSLRDDILTVIKNISSLKGCEMKVIFTTSEKIALSTKTFGQIEVCPLHDEQIGEILREIIKANGTTLAEDFDFGEGILSETNEIYLNIIIKQCEGLPFIASMVAMELTADEGMLTPADVVQLLFNQRVKSLSLEYYPPEDRIDFFKRDIEKVRDLDKYFLKTLNQHLDENNRNSIESLRSEFTTHDDKAKLEITKCFKLLTQPCIVRFLGKSREIDMHGIFRQCICCMTETDSIDDDVFRQLLMDSAKRYGLELTDKHIDCPKLLEEYVNKLGERENASKNSLGCGKEDWKIIPFNIVNKNEESENEEEADTLSSNTGFIAQASDQDDEIKMCARCNKSKQSIDNYLNIHTQPEMSQKPVNIDQNNIDYCTCRPKLNDLKVIDSIEDNTAVAEVHDNLFMKTSAFMKRSLDHSDKLPHFTDEVASENSSPSSPEYQVTLPKSRNVSPGLSDENQFILRANSQDEDTDVKFGRLSLNSLLNSPFTRKQFGSDERSVKQSNVGLHQSGEHNKSIEVNHLEIGNDLDENIPNFDTLLNETDNSKQVLSCTK